MRFEGLLAGLFITASGLVMGAPALQAGTPSKPAVEARAAVNAPLTVGTFKEKSAEEQANIIGSTLKTLKRNLWSETFPNGQKKPDALLGQNRQIVVILEKLFDFSDPDVIPEALVSLYNALHDADEDLPVERVFLAHIQDIVSEYERN